jgi:hypothetical protein
MATEELQRLRVLQAFATIARLDVDELVELTGIDEAALALTLSNMVAERVLRRVGNVYYRTVVEAHVPQFAGEDRQHLPLLLGLTEAEALTRIRMLGYMKRKLICDWHPVIDKLIGDYTRGLELVESLRYGACGSDDDDRSLEK